MTSQMKLTMKLTRGPDEIVTTTRKAWNKLFEVYGWENFPEIEARGILMATLDMTRSSASTMLLNLIRRGFAEYARIPV